MKSFSFHAQENPGDCQVIELRTIHECANKIIVSSLDQGIVLPKKIKRNKWEGRGSGAWITR
jgi:hypothetical protein